VKQILIYLNNRYNFILEDLDPLHCFVDASNPSQLSSILEECQRMLEANIFVKEDDDSKES
jgi:Transcription factor TFIIH complex subunit Tfb5